jgi:hypothetical protein
VQGKGAANPEREEKQINWQVNVLVWNRPNTNSGVMSNFAMKCPFFGSDYLKR